MALNMGVDWKDGEKIWKKAGEDNNKDAYITNGDTSR
jgi:hypothetical protein